MQKFKFGERWPDKFFSEAEAEQSASFYWQQIL